MSISMVLLAYKEEENLRVLLPKIIKALNKIGETYEIIVVDTATPLDNTPHLCEEFGIRYVNQRYPGFGGAFRTAIECAMYSKFFIMDSDGSHNPKYIPIMYNAMKPGVDLVIGSRYTKGGKTNDSGISILMSRTLNFVYRIALGISANDLSTDFRIYRTKQLKEVDLVCRNYDVLEEVLLKLKLRNKNFKIKEMPITFEKRINGKSKRQLIPFIISYIKTLVMLIGMRVSAWGK